MLSAAGGDAGKIRVFTPEEARSLSDQVSPGIVARAWEYYSFVVGQRPLGG